MNQNERDLMLLVKSYYDYQLMRIRFGNRLKRKKDGEEQKNNPKTNYDNIAEKETENKITLEQIYGQTKEYEKFLLKEIGKIINVHTLWKGFLKDVKGVGSILAAVIICSYDIHIAENVSKMLAYTGIAPGMVQGKRWNKNKTEIIATDILIKRDKKTVGFLCPYNSWLRSKMMGVLAGSFLKSNSPYKKFYDNYKNRLESLPEEEKEKRLKKSKNPSDKKRPYAGHINNMSKRYMIKMFLNDLYIAWRTLEGLPVRNLYVEEYLGKKHAS